MLEQALLVDASGAPIRYDAPTHSTDWDEVQEFCKSVYMPYRVRPLERFSRPDATMISAMAGWLSPPSTKVTGMSNSSRRPGARSPGRSSNNKGSHFGTSPIRSIM